MKDAYTCHPLAIYAPNLRQSGFLNVVSMFFSSDPCACFHLIITALIYFLVLW